ncbi:MAG: NAD(P)-dependent oxidoreductase, partial [Lentisphaeria bacterium]|nr:NAD(P)-dependent oxidoreductase [Lentisphaeria bacterium]
WSCGMKKIVVTGAKGGTGAGIVAVLKDRGYDVFSIDLLPIAVGDVNYKQIDLRDATGVNDAFAGADGVIHFGSVPGDAWLSTTEAFHNVAVAGFNVFQAAHNVGIRRVAWASSIEVYGDLREHPTLPITEESPQAPPGIYGASKVLLESLASDYCRWHNMAIAGFRLTRIIYDSAVGREKMKRYVGEDALGYDSMWSYIDARDVATACLAWLESDRQGAEAYNIGRDNVHSETPTAELLERHGFAGKEVTREHGEYESLFSSAKLKAHLGWQAEYDWRDIIAE